MSPPTESSPTNQGSGQNSQTFLGTSETIMSKEASISTTSKYVGFFKKRNTCFANLLLQALSVLHLLIPKSLLNMTKSYLYLGQWI